MRLKQYLLNELALKKAAVGVKKSTPSEFETVIQVEPPKSKKRIFLYDLFFFIALRIKTRDVFTTYFDLGNDDAERFADMISDYTWEISFETELGEVEQMVSNRESAHQVFAGVEESFKLFMKKYNPNLFYFTSVAGESSRIKLYNFLAKKIAKKNYAYIYYKGRGSVWMFGNKKDKLLIPSFEEFIEADIGGYAVLKGV
jgi:hypothetical protein